MLQLKVQSSTIPSQKLIKNPDDIQDKDLKAFILGSYAEATRTKFADMKNSILCKDIKLIAQSQSLAIKPISRKDNINV